MPFLRNTYRFVPQVRLAGGVVEIEDHSIDVFVSLHFCADLSIRKVRRVNSGDEVDAHLWRFGKAKPLLSKDDDAFVVPLSFAGRTYSDGLHERARTCKRTAALFMLFVQRERLQLEIELHDQGKTRTNLFLDLNYRLIPAC